MKSLEELTAIAQSTLGGEPERVARGLLEEYQRRLRHRADPYEVAVLLAALDAVRGALQQHAVSPPPPAVPEGRRAQERCPGSRQLVFGHAEPPLACSECGALVGVRAVPGGRRALAEYERAVPKQGGTDPTPGAKPTRERGRGPG